MNESKWEVPASNEYRLNVQNNPTKCNCSKDKSQRSEKWSLKQKEKQSRDWLPAVPNVSPDVPRSPLLRWLHINLTLLLQMWFYWLCSWFTPRQRADPPAPPRIPSNQKKPQRGGEGNGTSSTGGETLLGKSWHPAVQYNGLIPRTWSCREVACFPKRQNRSITHKWLSPPQTSPMCSSVSS